MRILLATYWLIPHVGGVWKYMTQIKESLEARGHEVDLLGNSPDYSKFHVINRGWEISKDLLRPMLDAKLNANTAPALFSAPLIAHYEMDRYLLELAAAFFGLHQYDIIDTQDIFAARALHRVKPRNKPLIAHVHGSVSGELKRFFQLNPQIGIMENDPPWKYFESIEHYGAMAGTPLITANQWMRNSLMNELQVSNPNIQVIQYGIDAQAFSHKASLGTDLRKPPGKKVIICPARLSFVKGIDILISALGILKNYRNDWVCWIVGAGDKREELENQVRGLSLQEDCLFLGERDDVPALLNLSDIFVHSCIQDNQPFSVMEAQLAGVPVCVSTAGGLPEMVEHGKTGLIHPVKDPFILSEHLRFLLENEPFRRSMSQLTKEWATSHWSMDLMIDRLLEVYRTALNQYH
ncbi:glycosyltransferase family 4 protein [Paenibacillus aceti]|uniref:N-acetyl-alpha-D-glucosaminyl L-malate synthase BshA n=1 Tax=Paenibacillus aceti TaxID=1820010 RepID=A0ABQ1VSE5_9BACL|nr:glycosyltransferase family 4 protein [Paenibacillus aceti]GGF89733.1 N-acetyl-alpha-D-glucosaminyl L-malate synthase BshA [Paenibacillus aceti]